MPTPMPGMAEVVMTLDLYSGAMDWERVYRTFHDPARVAVEIDRALCGGNGPVIFAGFQETASHLADAYPVTFIDYSPAITAHARQQYPDLEAVLTGDVTRLVGTLAHPHVVIACRLSAYWDSQTDLERLADSLRTAPRDTVLIDFFDLDQIEPGQRFLFDAADGRGEWEVLELVPPAGKEPDFNRVKMRVSYRFDDHSFSYVGARSFFRQQAIRRWSESNFPDYTLALGPPLLDRDPGFSLRLTRK